MKTKFRPILFSTEMIQAIEDGIKTQTRRTKGLENINEFPNDWKFINTSTDENNRYFHFTKEHIGKTKAEFVTCPFGKVGDVLWVRETFDKIDDKLFIYKAKKYLQSPKWKPSIHMPKEAARIFLEIKNIKVERLNDISEEDAKREGVLMLENGSYKNYYSNIDNFRFTELAKVSFSTLWGKIHGEESWYFNPWVWVIEFERIEKPENFIS